MYCEPLKWMCDVKCNLIDPVNCRQLSINVSELSKVWYSAIMNSQEEVESVANFLDKSSCNGLARIGGSTNLDQFTQFSFSDDYIANTSGRL